MTIATVEENRNGSQMTRREPAHVTDDSPFAMLLDTSKFEHMQRVATLFANSTIIPDHYRGNLGNCFIGLQMAIRLGVDPFMFFQKSYVVHGKPGLEAQLAIALVNSSGLFQDPLEYEIAGDDPEDPTDPSYMVRAWAVRKSTGKRINGPWVDWKMVNAEGWFDKPGSKRKTMPSLMFMYRAATFFARTACPERLMGMATLDELADTGPEPTQIAAAAAPAEPDGARTETARRSMQRPKPKHDPITTEASAVPQTAAEKILGPTSSLSPQSAAGTTTAPQASAAKSGRPQAVKKEQQHDDAPPVIDDDGPTNPSEIADVWAATKTVADKKAFLIAAKTEYPAMYTAALKTAAILKFEHADERELSDAAWNLRFEMAKVGL